MYCFETFALEKYRDLETLVIHHSRSLQMTQFDRSRMTSYSPSTVTLALACIISELWCDIAANFKYNPARYWQKHREVYLRTLRL